MPIKKLFYDLLPLFSTNHTRETKHTPVETGLTVPTISPNIDQMLKSHS